MNNEQVRAALLADLTEAAAKLRYYEASHRAKKTEDSIRKAEVNAGLAGRFEATIALATSAAPTPERSGKLADMIYKEVGSFLYEGACYVATSSDDPRGIKLYRPDPADSSSAAPSDLKERIEALREVGSAYMSEEGRDALAYWIECFLAAPAPTGESLSVEAIVQVARVHGVGGNCGIETAYTEAQRENRQRLVDFVSAIRALATPRQTEDDSGLSAAARESLVLPKLPAEWGTMLNDNEQEYPGYSADQMRCYAIDALVASTFTPKEK